MRPDPLRLAPRDFYAQNRGGGPLSLLLSQRIASYAAYTAHRVGATPAMLTVTNLVLCLTGTTVLFLGSDSAVLCVVAAIAWQLGYAFDCSDGQLARATRTTSSSGGRLDVLCDFAGQSALLVAVAAVLADRTDLPMPILFFGVGIWMFSLLLSVLSGDKTYTSLSGGRRRTRTIARGIRDHAVVLVVLGLGVTLSGQPVVLATAFLGYGLLNVGLLAALILREFRSAHRAAREAGPEVVAATATEAVSGRGSGGVEASPVGRPRLSSASAE